MSGFLRFFGLMNAAVWLGAAAFYVLAAEPAASSRRMMELIGTNNFPFFSVAIGAILTTRFLYLFFVCAALAVIHMGAEWLYLGKYTTRSWLGLLAGLCFLGLLQSWIVQPNLRRAHEVQFRQATPPAQREAAGRSFRAWRIVSGGLNYVILAGLGVYLWRVSNPSDPMRFVSARQFRS